MKKLFLALVLSLTLEVIYSTSDLLFFKYSFSTQRSLSNKWEHICEYFFEKKGKSIRIFLVNGEYERVLFTIGSYQVNLTKYANYDFNDLKKFCASDVLSLGNHFTVSADKNTVKYMIFHDGKIYFGEDFIELLIQLRNDLELKEKGELENKDLMNELPKL